MNTRRMVIGASGALLLSIGLFPALRAEAAPQSFGAVASAAQETTAPAAGDLNAVGVIDLSIDSITGQVCVASSITGLSGDITAAHIHAGGAGVSGPVVVPLLNTATSVSGCTTTTPTQAQAILAAPNNFYFNAHTAASPGGALRGQITTSMFNASLNGANEVPGPGDPDGTGSAVVAVNTTANQACVWVSVNAIDLPAAAAHIHSGAVGVAGPVVVALTAPATPVSASCGTAASGVIAAIAAQPTNHYVNVHTAPFPGGAVRGNLSVRVPAVLPAGSPIVLVPTTAAPTTVASTVAATTTAAPATTAAPTTTVEAPTTTAAPIVEAPTTQVPAAEAAPAEAVEADPTFTG